MFTPEDILYEDNHLLVVNKHCGDLVQPDPSGGSALEDQIYSHFQVGAAARLRSGKILYGSNFESEVYPAGLCAERSLMFYAQANYADDPIETLAIASNPSARECYPCGQCRQVMVDVERRQGSPMRVIMSGNGTATVVDTAARLLPFTFVL